jgi:hypothetical protein
MSFDKKHFEFWDEMMELRTDKAYEALLPQAAAAKEQQLLCTPTPAIREAFKNVM